MLQVRRLLRVTAVRLSLIYTLIFGLFAVGLIYYVSESTVGALYRQTIDHIRDEVSELQLIYRRGNIGRLVRAMELRSRAPGSGVYLITDPLGRVIAGNIQELDVRLLQTAGWRDRPFAYRRLGSALSDEDDFAIAQVFILPGGMRMLVGRDTGEPARFQSIISSSVMVAIGAMVAFGLLAWLLIGRRALVRIDTVSQSVSRILDGDLKERLPLSGTGDEFDRLSERMNALLQKISLLNEGLKQVSDNIAHDLKTPLTRLQNRAEAALRTDATKEEMRDAMAQMLDESNALIRTFNALLMISRVEAGSVPLEFSELDLKQVIEDVVELYEPLAEEAGVSLQVEPQAECHITANRELIGQAVANLIDNALKYGSSTTSEGAMITISVSEIESGAVISVADNGTGIPDGDRERVKERFVRLDKSRTRPGSGLGLSLVSAVAKLHKGELLLEGNAPGLRAILKLPVQRT
ncbi:MAG: ATP-binding protein [Pseudomonadota bacterium]